MAKDLSNPLLNLFAIIVGFVATALTFIAAAQDLPQMKRLNQTTHFQELIEYHWAAICLGLFATIMALVVIVVCKTKPFSVPQNLIFTVWIYLSLWALAAFFRVVLILRIILKPPDKVKKEKMNTEM
jgi:hypothetical protein